MRRETAMLYVSLFFFWCLFPPQALSSARPSGEKHTTEYTRNFIGAANNALAPVYGPLAGQIVSSYGLAEKKGVGIDLGSGPGHLIIELCRHTSRMRWINADINPHFFPYFLEQAQQAGFSRRVKAVQADAHALPFPDNYAEIVVSRGSFQFWKDKKRAFAEIYRVLKPGGTAFIGRGFSDNLPVEVARLVREQQNGGPRYDPAQTAAQLRETMQVLGIENFRVRIPEPPGSEGINYGVWLEFHKPPALRLTEDSGQRVFEMDTVVITGIQPRDLIAEPKTESAGLEPATTVVTQAEIGRQGAKTLVEAMEYVPGAWIESRGRKVKQFFSIRGQRYPYPDYALDGAWQREFHELPYFFPAEEVERIEVMRSSAALLSGLSGLAGVVNVIPRQYHQRETSLQLEYGSFNTRRLRLSHGGNAGDLSYALSFGAPRTDGPDGRHADEGMTHFRGSAYWNPNKTWSVTAHFLHLDGHRELARAQQPAAARFRESLETFDPFRATLASVKTMYKPGDRASTEFIVNLANRDHTFISETSTPHQSTREHDYEFGVNLTQSVALSKENVLRFGGLYNHWVAPNGKRFFVGRRTDLETYSAVVVDEHSFGPVSIDAGLRWARTYINEYGAFNIDGSPKGLQNVDPVKNQWEPSVSTANLGSSYSVSDNLSLHFNLSRGNIKPGTGDLDVELNEPRVEKRTKLDIGLKLKRPGLGQFSLAGFLMNQKDAIVLSGRMEELGGRLIELYLNRDQRQTGLEIEARVIRLSGNLQLFGNFLALRSTAADNGDMVRNRELPRFITSAGIYASRAKLDLNLLWKHVSGYESTRFAAGNPPLPQPLGDYNNLNLTVGWTFAARPVNRFYLEVKNIADSEFSTVVGYPDYGRRFTVGWLSVYK